MKRIPVLPLLLAATLSLSACAMTPPHNDAIEGILLTSDRKFSLSPPPGETAKISSKHPKLGLVLGGGGLRGYAHIGMLQALDDAGIRPHLVVGTSVGSIVGGIYAAGASGDQLWKIAESLRPSSLVDLTFRGAGLLRGEALVRWVNDSVKNKRIEQFPVRFAAVATDIERALPYVITQGDAGEALRASAAIPGVFLPVHSSRHILVDGGVVSLVPVYAARALGADVVLAVDIYCHGEKYSVESMASMWLRVAQVQSCALSHNEAMTADILITPAISPAATGDVKAREEARRRGYEATVAVLPRLRKLLESNSDVKSLTPKISPSTR